ncbi:MAG: septum formation protein Maf [Spirochaetales bacterium]|nr:septum formation protein Maf [Spirochaetales bacterium]
MIEKRDNENNPLLVLASESPRRQELLRQMGLDFQVIPSDIEEEITGDNPPLLAISLALQKVNAVLNNLGKDRWVLGADTLVIGNRILGKPASRAEAEEMLTALSGKRHQVFTGIALHVPGKEKILTATEVSTITFSEISREELSWYLDTKEWRGAAGAYRIQGLASRFIPEIQGSYSNVVGLPIHTIYGMLKANNYPLLR